jgi:hypothetical protein
MKRRTVLLLFLAATATRCASHLSVRTEIYDGEGLVTGKSFSARAAERARATREAVNAIEATVVQPVTEDFLRTIRTIAETVPEAVAGGAEKFRDDYVAGIRDRALRPLQPEIDHLRGKAGSIESKALAGAGNDELRADLVGMQTELQQLIDAVQARVDQVTRTEQQVFVRAVRLNVEALPNDRLTTLTGLAVTTAAEKRAAADFFVRRAEVAVLDVGDAVGRALLAPVEAAKQATTETLMLPLDDPNVARIVGKETDLHWRKYVNDVYSTNWFGNSETAFRMEGLGENHIKSVLFDPSEVSKVGMNVFSNTLRITAAAYGFALPQQEKKDAQGNVTETIPATPTKAGIDSEIARIQGDRTVRGLKMEQLFWKSTDAASKVAGTAADTAAADAVKAIADLIDCMADEIEKPQTTKCGGN